MLSTAVMHFDAIFLKNAVHRAIRLAAPRLTRPQRVALFINLKPRFGLQRPRSESVKRRGCPLAVRQRGLSRGETPQGAKALGGRITGGRDHVRFGFAMLSVPTLWTVFVINFLALGLIWAYVMRSYPSFDAARFWTASTFAAAAGAALAMLRVVATDSLLPLLAAGTLLVFAACLAAMGIRKFFDAPVTWRGTLLITGLTFAGLAIFIFGYDSVRMPNSI